MNDLTRILEAAAAGDADAAAELLPRVYQELKRMAAAKMRRERAGHTLDATALVHEAYLRLVDKQAAPAWNNRAHFFAAAAEAMRRILVENARRKSRLKHGGDHQRVELSSPQVSAGADPSDVLAIHEALDRLAVEDEVGAQVVKLRYFTGLSVEEAGEALGLSRAGAYRHWKYARAWLQCELADDECQDS